MANGMKWHTRLRKNLKFRYYIVFIMVRNLFRCSSKLIKSPRVSCEYIANCVDHDAPKHVCGFSLGTLEGFNLETPYWWCDERCGLAAGRGWGGTSWAMSRDWHVGSGVSVSMLTCRVGPGWWTHSSWVEDKRDQYVLRRLQTNVDRSY
jgi:hypothetical protein